MKKSLIILSLFIVLICNVYAQDNEPVKLDDGCKILRTMPLENGLVMITGREYYFTNKNHWKISYYNADLTLRYEVPILNSAVKHYSAGLLVASPDGNNVYHLQTNNSKNKLMIMHMDSMGTVTNTTIKNEFKYSRLNAIFVDDEYMYFVTKEKNKEKGKHHKKKYDNPKLQFVKVSNADLSVSKCWLDLPDPESDATQWSYFGNTTEVSYFVSRKIDDKVKESYRVAVIDEDGKLLDDFTLNTEVTKTELRAEANWETPPGALVIDNHNVTVAEYHSQNYTTTVYFANPEAFGNIMFDNRTNGFYVYGLCGPKTPKRKIWQLGDLTQVSEFYIDKFDQDGKELWKYQGKLSVADQTYKNSAGFNRRGVHLETGLGGKLRFQAYIQMLAYSYEFDPETGKLIASFTNLFEDFVTPVDLGTCRKSGEKSELVKFMNKRATGNFSQLVYRLESNTILVRNYFDDHKIELYSFGDE